MSSRIGSVDRIVLDISVWGKCLWFFVRALPCISDRKPPLPRCIPPRPQVNPPHTHILPLAGKAEVRRRRTTLSRTPGVVVVGGGDGPGITECAADAAQPIRGIPRPRAADHACQAFGAIEVIGGGASNLGLEDLAQGRGEVLGEARGGAATGLRYEYAIAVIGVGAALAACGDTDQAVERVVGRRARAVVGEVACCVIGPAGDLIGGVVGACLGAVAIAPGCRAIADKVVGVGVHRARMLHGGGQALQAVIGVADGARGRTQLGDKGIGATCVGGLVRFEHSTSFVNN